MKHVITLIGIATVLLLGTGMLTNARAGEEAVVKAEKEASAALLEAEYKEALSAAEKQKEEAVASLEKAREQLKLAAEQQALSGRQMTEARAVEEAEMARMHEELNLARRQLMETSREIARVNREVARARSGRHTSNFVVRTSEKPVIGVILGDGADGGVKVLGVSPDGPSERAGIKPGDIIFAVDGRELSKIEESADARDALLIALREIKVDEPVVISVRRESKKVDLTVVPEVREPLAWQTITRFTTAPPAPEAPEKVITIENIVVPEIDTVAMAEQIEKVRAGIEQRRALREAARVTHPHGEWEFEFDELSELGGLALEDATVWFGLPMAEGLQLAEINPGLGAYFKTDRGVLVLKARADNDLQLEPGDVILQVGETEVNTPAEFMRALRGLDSGDELVMDIKRERKQKTLKSVMPDYRTGFFRHGDNETHTFVITSSTD